MSKDNDSAPKIGSGHAEAMLRLGLREARAMWYPESNVAQPDEYGLFGTKTPGEVAADRQASERDLNEEPQRGSVLDGLNQGMEQPREEREMEREEPEMEREEPEMDR